MSNKYLNPKTTIDSLEKGVGRLLFQQQQQQKNSNSRNNTPNKSAIKSKQSNNKLAPPVQQINTQDKQQILSSPSLNQEIVRTQIENEDNGRTITLEVDQQSIEQFNNLEHQDTNNKHESKLNENVKASHDKNIVTTEVLSDNQHQDQGSSDNIKISPRRKDSKDQQKDQSPNQKIIQNEKASQKAHQQQQTPHSEDNLFEDEDFGEFQEEKFQDQEQIQLKGNQQNEENQYEDDDFDDFEDSSPTKSSENYQNKDEVINEQPAILTNHKHQEQQNTINQQKQSDDINSNVFNILDCHPSYINNQFKSIASSVIDKTQTNFDYYQNFQIRETSKSKIQNDIQFLEYEKRFNSKLSQVFREPALQAFCLQHENVVGSHKRIHKIDDINGLNDEIRLEYIGISEELSKLWEKSKQKTNLLELCGVDDEESAIQQDQVYYEIQEKKLNHIINNQTVIKSKKQ
ncbi:hypothetical protein ABPG74_010041 [Tetrahymena malaccensis]